VHNSKIVINSRDILSCTTAPLNVHHALVNESISSAYIIAD